MADWTLLAPEYPPALGGVAGYVEQVARGLATRGDTVEVWAPRPADSGAVLPGVVVRELEHGFDRRARAAIAASVRARPNAVTLVEYVPRMLGAAAVAWLSRLPGAVWVMFHEVAHPFERGQPLKHRARALETHALAFGVKRRADRVLVSVPGCERALEWLGGRDKPATWLPIPSNLPTALSSFDRTSFVESLGFDPGRPIVGHFSSFGERVASMLERTLAELFVRDPHVQVLLLGGRSNEFVERFVQTHPGVEGRLRALGRVDEVRAAEAIVACDVLLYPFPDGISTRRTSVMAALALGKAVVTNHGENSEGLFERERCVALVSSEGEIAARVTTLLADRAGREKLGARAREVYFERFSIDVVVAGLSLLRSGADQGHVD